MRKFLLVKKSKFKFYLLLFLFILFLLGSLDFIVVGANNDSGDFTENLSISTNEILDNIDFSELDSIIHDIDEYELFDNLSIRQKLSLILNGEFLSDYGNILSVLFSVIFSNVKNILPLIFTIVGIGLICSLIVNFQNDEKKNDIIYFVCFSILITIVLVSFKEILSVTNNVLDNIEKQMGVVFPLLITMLSSIGSLSAVSIYNPLVTILTSVISFVFGNFLYPIFILIFLFTILNNLSSSIKLDKFIGFFTSTFKWSIGTIFTLFVGFLSLQGISAGKFDSVSIKATKFAVKSYIPIIGSYISEGMDFIVLGSVLIKNGIGLIGVFILFISIISPIVNIVILKLGLHLSSAIIEMSGNVKMSNFINSCSKLLILPIVLILGVALMYIITICLIMCTANIF